MDRRPNTTYTGPISVGMDYKPHHSMKEINKVWVAKLLNWIFSFTTSATYLEIWYCHKTFGNYILTNVCWNAVIWKEWRYQTVKGITSSGSVSPSNSTMTGAFILHSNKGNKLLHIRLVFGQLVGSTPQCKSICHCGLKLNTILGVGIRIQAYTSLSLFIVLMFYTCYFQPFIVLRLEFWFIVMCFVFFATLPWAFCKEH